MADFVFEKLRTVLSITALALFGGAVGCTVTTTATPTNTCNTDATVSCAGGTTGYSCSGSATPSNTATACDVGVAGANAVVNYCCINFTSTACATDGAVAGCGAGSFGFSCNGSGTPEEADSSLNCDAGTADSLGDVLYCCTSGAAATPACAADTSVTCTGTATGYSCSGGVTPETTTLDCSEGISDPNGNTDYCCIPFTSSTCMQDQTVQGCVPGSYGFSCTGTDTPQTSDSSLNCSTGTAGANGATLYCCTN